MFHNSSLPKKKKNIINLEKRKMVTLNKNLQVKERYIEVLLIFHKIPMQCLFSSKPATINKHLNQYVKIEKKRFLVRGALRCREGHKMRDHIL